MGGWREGWRVAPPVYLLLRGLALQQQLLVGDLQPSGRHVQLLVHVGVLLVHLPQHLQLLAQVLQRPASECTGQCTSQCTGECTSSRLKVEPRYLHLLHLLLVLHVHLLQRLLQLLVALQEGFSQLGCQVQV